MKKTNNTRIKIAFKLMCVFISSLLFLTFDAHFCDHLEMGKQSWADIIQDPWLYIIGALIMTIAFYLKFC